jgi:hypothetical protein
LQVYLSIYEGMLDGNGTRAQQWVDTGHQDFQGSKDKVPASILYSYHISGPAASSNASPNARFSSSFPMFLEGKDNDLLIPRPNQINHAFEQSQTIQNTILILSSLRVSFLVAA